MSGILAFRNTESVGISVGCARKYLTDDWVFSITKTVRQREAKAEILPVGRGSRAAACCCHGRFLQAPLPNRSYSEKNRICSKRRARMAVRLSVVSNHLLYIGWNTLPILQRQSLLGYSGTNLVIPSNKSTLWRKPSGKSEPRDVITHQSPMTFLQLCLKVRK